MTAPLVTAKWLNDHLNDPDLLVLDASQQDNKAGLKSEHDEIQIKGARFFDLEKAFSRQDCDLPNMLPAPDRFEQECRNLGLRKSSRIVVYDKLGVYSSPRVWWMFKVMGHDRVSVLDGGLPAWLSEGCETVPLQRRRFEPGDFSVNFKPEGVVDAAFVSANLENQKAIVIDARSEGRFRGVAPEPRQGLRSGHIPKSVNIPFQMVLDKGQFKSKAELLQLFKTFNFEEKPLLFSCGSGITACIVLLASALVQNNPTAVYDGSWTEWAQLEGFPIA